MKKLSVEKFMKASQSLVEIGGHTFTVQRPTFHDMGEMNGKKITLEWGAQFVVDWKNVKESDLIPGGDPEDVEFDIHLFMAWIKDQPDLWIPIVTEVVDSYKRHEEEVIARKKL